MRLVDEADNAVRSIFSNLLAPAQPEYEQPNIPRSSNLSRAATWDDFKGNETVVRRLQRVIKAAKIRGTVLPSILFYGPPGCGKTTLAKIVASSVGAHLLEITGSSLTQQIDLVRTVDDIKILQAQGKDVIVFIDEIHGITKSRGLGEDIWLPLLEEGKLMHSCVGKSWTDGETEFTVDSNIVQVDNVCWIGATTNPGRLHPAIRDRFYENVSLADYTKKDLYDIVYQYCNSKEITISPLSIQMIADRARYRPRIALQHILRKALEESVIETEDPDNKYIKGEDVISALKLLGIMDFGLRSEDVRVLKALREVYPKGLGIKSIAGVADVAPDIVSEMVFPLLQKEGWIKTTNSRFLTEKGKQFCESVLKFEPIEDSG